MKKEVKNLYKHKKQLYSQNGEEGVLEYLLEKLPERDNWCVEFGAWDGMHLSNTFYFIEKYNFNAVYIEGDKEKAKQLEKNMSKYKNNLREIICLDKFVQIESDDSLDNILSKTKIPADFDLLSVDIDSDDYHILKSLEKYKPKIVIVEINQLIKPGVEQINKIGEFQKKGSLNTLTSITSMTKMMNQKGYSLAANIRTNAIYVKKEFLNLFYAVEPTEFEVFTYEDIRVKDLKPKELIQRVYYMGGNYITKKILKRLGVSLRLYKRLLVQVHKLYELLPKRYPSDVKKTSITLLSCGSSAIGGKNFIETFKRFKEWGYLIKINPNILDSEYIIFYFRPEYKIKELTEELFYARQKGSKVIAYVIEPITFNLYQDDHLRHKLLELTDAIVVNSVGYIKTDEWIYTKGFLNYLEKIVLIEEPLIESQMRNLSRKVHTKNNIVAAWHGHYRNMQRWIEGEIPDIVKDENSNIYEDSRYYGNLKENIGVPIETICGYNLDGDCDRWHPGKSSIVRMLQKYDIGLAPFYTGTKRVDTKPFGLKIYSYIMAGLPVVASPIPDYLRWLKHDETCLFAESKEEWREACNRLKSPELRQKIADNARSVMLCNFSHDRILGKYELLFNSLRQNQQLPYLLKDSCSDFIR